MTRRSSLRAHAREIYRDLAAKKDAKQTADPPSPRGLGGQAAHNLTEKVRALYEDSAVPVAEIAATAGVTERTLYKYARKGGWKPRYAWIDRGGVNRRRGWRAKDGFAPVKGAGARFIRRVDKDKSFATGLKATDPEGAARAASACSEAASLSRQAQREAEAERRTERLNRAIEWNCTALGNLRELHERRKERRPGPLDGRYEDILFHIADMALARWQTLVAEEEAARQAG